MFLSISKCIPNTLVYTEFVAERQLELNIDESIEIKINNSVVSTRPITISANNVVRATLLSPENFSQHSFVQYSIDGNQLSFAVANKAVHSNKLTPKLIKNRWYNLAPKKHLITYKDLLAQSTFEFGYNSANYTQSKFTKLLDHGKNNFILRYEGLTEAKNTEDNDIWSVLFAGNNYVSVIESASLTPTENFTIEFNLRLLKLNTIQPLVNNATVYNNSYYNIFVNSNNQIVVELFNGTISNTIISSDQISNEWVNIAIVITNSTINLFINGNLQGTTQKTVLVNKSVTFIGHNSRSNTFLEGYMSSLRISSTNLYSVTYLPSFKNLNADNNTELLIFQDAAIEELDIHAIPDPISKSVYFYNKFGQLLDNILLPSEPVEVVKANTLGEQFYLASCKNKSTYKINLNSGIYSKMPPEVKYTSHMLDWLFELSFETDIPFKGNFIPYLKFQNEKRDVNNPNCLYFANGLYWIGGFKKIWLLDSNFNLVKTYNFSSLVIGIKSLGNKTVVVGKDGTVKVIDYVTDTITQIYSSQWLSPPVIANNKVYFCDSFTRKVISLDENLVLEEIFLENFCPSNITSFENILYVCGHDSNEVKSINILGEISTIIFPDKVTWVSVTSSSIIASHYLKDEVLLNHESNVSVIIPQTARIAGGTGIIGIQPIMVKSLFAPIFSPVSQQSDIKYWVDGIPSQQIVNGCYFGLSTQFQSAHTVQYPIVFGDSVLDIIIQSQENNFYPRSFEITAKKILDNKVEFSYIIPDYYEECYISIDYGKLYKNGNLYDGLTTFKPLDLLSIEIPFGVSLNNISSCLQIGKKQLYIPVNINNIPTIKTEFENFQMCEWKTTQLTIEYDGEYFASEHSQNYSLIDLFPWPSQITNLGGQFNEDAPLTNINSISGNPAIVSSLNGFLDIYFDLNSPRIVKGFSLLVGKDSTTITGISSIDSIVPLNFKIHASLDSIEWTEIQEFTNIVANWNQSYVTFNIANDTEYRYYRIENTSTQNEGVGFSNIKFHIWEKQFNISLNGVPINHGKISLKRNDVISVGLLSSSRFFDDTSFLLVGANKNYFVSVITSPVKTIQLIEFSTIIEPKLRTKYVSEKHLVYSTTNDTFTLKSKEDFSIVKNNDLPLYEISVTNGDEISIEKIFNHIFETKNTILLHNIDYLHSEQFYVPVAHVNFQHVQLDPFFNELVFYINTLNKFSLLQNSQSINLVQKAAADFNSTHLLYADRRTSLRYPASTFLYSPLISAKILHGKLASQYRFKSIKNAAINMTKTDPLESEFDVQPNSLISGRFASTNLIEEFLVSTRLLSIHFPTSFKVSNLTELFKQKIEFQISNIFNSIQSSVNFSNSALTEIIASYLNFNTSLLSELSTNQLHILEPQIFDIVAFNKTYQLTNIFDINNDVKEFRIASLNELNKFYLQHLFAGVNELYVHTLRVSDIPVFRYIKLIETEKLLISFIKVSLQDPMFISSEQIINGFFLTAEDALAEAARVRVTPAVAYKIPDTNFYSYRKIYDYIDACTLVPVGKMSAAWLIQGG